MADIQRVVIRQLHDNKDVELRLKSRHCVLIGPNGTGKSTALQIIAYALGRQWRQLADLHFTAVEFTFDNGATISLTREDCDIFGKLSKRSQYRFSTFSSAVEIELYNKILSTSSRSAADLQTIASTYDLSPAEIQRIERQLLTEPRHKDAQKRVRAFADALDEQQQPPIVYLPTYRRIELELKKLLQDVPEPYRKSAGVRYAEVKDDDFMTEIIRFGMDDINAQIADFESSTRDMARNLFNKMMASYIKEMANSEVLSVTELRDLQINREQIDVTLSRIEEGLLEQNEKAKISDIIMELVEGRAGGHPPFYKKWLAHFFSKLYWVNKEIEEVEKPFRSLITTLNRYLKPKTVSYDIESYHFSVNDEYENELSLTDLSSGEKQIVSMMSELFFKTQEFSIMIDEPELSLSVPWQVSFLEDVSRSPNCRQIFAVTHSPFIYDNSFSDYVVDFSRFA